MGDLLIEKRPPTQFTVEVPFETGMELVFGRPMSDAEFERFAQQNPDLRIELDTDGKIIIMPPVHLNSGYQEGEIFGELRNYVRKSGLGRAFSPSTGFKLPDGSTRSADAAWVSQEQLEKLTPEERHSFARIVPEFVVEVRSDSDVLKKLKDKMTDTWMANGVRLAWLLDPQERIAYIYRADGSIEVVHDFTAELSGEDVLPGFVFDLKLLEL